MSEPLPAAADARVALVAIGDELLAGKHADTNSPWMAARLADLDLTVDRIVTANDDLEELTELFRALCARYPLVLSTGGLGPTLDDVTRHAAAAAAGVELVRDEAVLEALRARFEALGRPMAATNERQALFPLGADVVANRVGTAAGFRVAVGASRLVCLPGPPREMHVVFDEEVFPELARAAEREARRGRWARRAFHLFGLTESGFAEQAGGWMDRPQNPLMSVTVSSGVLSVVLRARAGTVAEAESLLAPRVAAFRERFSEHLFSEESPDLALALGRELLARRLSITLAESCTGGLVAARLTGVPGISAVFERGFVTYSDEAKRELLGVPEELLRANGAVSSEVAGAMARGAQRAARSDLAVSVTGIAGPDGGSPEKPVGTVWFGVARGAEVHTVRRAFPPGDRDWIRGLASQTALDLARRAALD